MYYIIIPTFYRGKWRRREAQSMGKKEDLEIWIHNLILAIPHLGNVFPPTCPLPLILQRPFHMTSASWRFSLPKHLLHAL